MALVGSGGDGVMATASMILRTAAKRGLYGLMTQSYGPQIRGGESAAHVTLGLKPVTTVDVNKDMIVCFRFGDLPPFQKELRAAPHAAVFCGEEKEALPEILRNEKGILLQIPFGEMLEKNSLPEIAKNVLVFGILLKALGWDLSEGEECVREVFNKKSSEVIASNLKAMEAGYHHFKTLALPFETPSPDRRTSRWVLTGNEACARAAIHAGCRFYAGYPITPSSEILEAMNRLLPQSKGKVVQAEDEMAALGMVIGASYGGTPSMTATSGPGFSLMTELLGLSSMAEIPLVVIDCQRAGPATGLPSRTEQGDLWHAIYGGHGDFPRVVLAPANVSGCYQTLFRAFRCAEMYQLPVIVLSDAMIAQCSEIFDPIDTSSFPSHRRWTASPSDGEFRRFDLNQAFLEGRFGVTESPPPGTPGAIHCIAGIEHTEKGTPSADGGHHEKMNRKRFLKLEGIAEESAGWYRCCGDPKAEHAIITWGSTAGAVLRWMEHHPEAALFVPEILNPFPQEALRNFLKGRKKISVVELNYQGQLHHHLRALGLLPDSAKSMRRSGGIPLQVSELEMFFQQGGLL